MKAISLVIALGALAAAQRTALWVPECGDEVLMLGTDVADEFRSLNTLSVEDINKILAFHTYTVVHKSNAPSGFRYNKGYLVKDPPSGHTITTCTTPYSGARETSRATLTGYPSRTTQPETRNATTVALSQPSQVAAPTSCYTTGRPVSESALVMDQIFSFCGLHKDLATPTSISTTVTYGGRPMLFEVKAVACDPESGVSGGAVSFESPTGRPTDALQASNKALWPCVNLWNIWEYCDDKQKNAGRGGFGILDCMAFSLRPL
ncbi:hypothetical protein MY1884_005966 [Beauveria asiatica]